MRTNAGQVRRARIGLDLETDRADVMGLRPARGLQGRKAARLGGRRGEWAIDALALSGSTRP